MRIQRNQSGQPSGAQGRPSTPQPSAEDTAKRRTAAQPAPEPEPDPEPEYEDYDDEEEERPRRRRFPIALIIIVVFLALVVAAGWQVLQLYNEVGGRTGSLGDEVTVTIEEGANANQIARQLAEAGIVEHEWLFRAYAQYSGKAGDLQPGEITLRSGMSYNDILQQLSQQRVFRKTVTVTFPEGYTAVAIAQLMEENGLCTASDFLACANGDAYTEKDGSEAVADFSDYDFWNQIPDNEGRLLRCEGYLFPDTYEFFEDDTIENYVRTFYNQFQKVISDLTDQIDANPDDCINSIDDAVILASFIQEEAGLESEDYKVSACFHNRLESDDPQWADHRLESNASSYITNDADNNYLWNSPMAEYMGWVEAGAIPEEVLAAYDTYRISGLPAGAISNPGKAAIEAALNPDQEYIDEGYYFFVTGNPNGDYPGEYFYAKTANEHEANKDKAGW